ncbi:MAG: hypothetical protein V9F06_15570 [Thermomicrobiales bacterium]
MPTIISISTFIAEPGKLGLDRRSGRLLFANIAAVDGIERLEIVDVGEEAGRLQRLIEASAGLGHDEL